MSTYTRFEKIDRRRSDRDARTDDCLTVIVGHYRYEFLSAADAVEFIEADVRVETALRAAEEEERERVVHRRAGDLRDWRPRVMR